MSFDNYAEEAQAQAEAAMQDAQANAEAAASAAQSQAEGADNAPFAADGSDNDADWTQPAGANWAEGGSWDDGGDDE
jgi:hypothetical protein